VLPATAAEPEPDKPSTEGQASQDPSPAPAENQPADSTTTPSAAAAATTPAAATATGDDEEWEEMEQDDNDVMLQGTVQKNSLHSKDLFVDSIPTPIPIPTAMEGIEQSGTTTATSATGSPQAQSAPAQGEGQTAEKIPAEDEASTKPAETPAPVVVEKEEPFVPEEEPTEKTWLRMWISFPFFDPVAFAYTLDALSPRRCSYDAASVVYSLQMLLPDFTKHVGCYIDVNISADHLTLENTGITSRALWGNHVYADDSDVVAGLALAFILTFSPLRLFVCLFVCLLLMPLYVQFLFTVTSTR